MALTKTTTLIDDWTAVAQNDMVEFSTIDFTATYAQAVLIQAAIQPGVAHTAGTKFIVQVLGNTADDEDWADLVSWVGLGGTADSDPITNAPLGSGETTITIADTTGFTVNGLWRFIFESGTLANSELIRQVGYTTNTNVVAVDGVKNSHVATTPLWSIANSWQISVPIEWPYARVVVVNTVVPAGAITYAKVRSAQVTAL